MRQQPHWHTPPVQGQGFRAVLLLLRSLLEGRGACGNLQKEASSRELERSMRRLDWLLVIACCGAFAATVALHPKRAHAHDPDTHQADDLAKATSAAYGLCCNGKDWIRIETWESMPSGYRILYKGEWLDAPRTVRVNNMENPDGEAKAWIYYMGQKPYIRCFMAGARS